MSDHDPFNEPHLAHEQARKLMPEEFFWDCGDEEAPFGSDEGSDSYYEWRDWRSDNPSEELVKCLSWILSDRQDEYNEHLYEDSQIERDIASPDEAFLSEAYDTFTLDATIIATGLSQLIDEGKIDRSAKPYLRTAVSRQLHPKICTSPERRIYLKQFSE
jgi:uncharacterized protein YfeS